MTIQRLENVGIAVDDLAAVTTFFVELGLWIVVQARRPSHRVSYRLDYSARDKSLPKGRCADRFRLRQQVRTMGRRC